MSIFADKTLMITGGTGSFGNAVLNRFLDTDIRQIRIFSRDEKKQDDMRHEFQAKFPEASGKIQFFIGDVRDLASVKNAMNGVVEDRNYVFQRLIASFYLIVFLAMVVFSLVVMVFGNLLASLIVRHVPGMERLFSLLLHFRGIFSWFVMTLLFALMYTFIPNCRQRFAWQLPGAAFSAVTWNVFSWGFSIYVRHSGGFDMYGSLTTIVILMLWLYFCFYLFLIGAHINRFLAPFRRVREKQRLIRREKGTGRRCG